MNLWSMRPDGSDPTAHTDADGIDLREFAADAGRAVYRRGADLHLLDLASGDDRVVPIALRSDFDQTRERWVHDPMDWLTHASLSADGARVALTARGQVWIAPTGGAGRLVPLAAAGVRYRQGTLSADGSVIALGDGTGEVELWRLPGDGVGEGRALTSTGSVLRRQIAPSPSGDHVAHTDNDQRLFLLDVNSGADEQIDESPIDRPADLAWSADGRWLAYTVPASNMVRIVRLYDTATGRRIDATTDRAASYSPTFSHDGRWLYVLTDRHFETVVRNPWSPLWSEPFFDEADRDHGHLAAARRPLPVRAPLRAAPRAPEGRARRRKGAQAQAPQARPGRRRDRSGTA